MKCAVVMWILTSVAVLSFPASEGDHHIKRMLNYESLLNYFEQVIQPFKSRKAEQNQLLDKCMDDIIADIEAVNSGVPSVHSEIQQLLALTQHHDSLCGPLTEQIAHRLILADKNLNIFIAKCGGKSSESSSISASSSAESYKVETASKTTSDTSGGSAKEQVDAHTGYTQTEGASSVEDVLTQHFYSRTADEPEKLNVETAIGSEAIVSASDALAALVEMGRRIERHQALRYQALIPKIVHTQRTLSSILYLVNHFRDDVGLLKLSMTRLANSTQHRIKEINNHAEPLLALTQRLDC